MSSKWLLEYNERNCDTNIRTDYMLMAIVFLIQCTRLWDIGTIQLQVRSKVGLKQAIIIQTFKQYQSQVKSNFL